MCMHLSLHYADKQILRRPQQGRAARHSPLILDVHYYFEALTHTLSVKHKTRQLSFP